MVLESPVGEYVSSAQSEGELSLEAAQTPMLRTALYEEHVEQGAKMAPFAGYMMPIQYAEGVKQEHLWVRENCGVFDVSHMGQWILKGKEMDKMLSILTPSNIMALPIGKAKYTVLTNPEGGIIDDLIITRLGHESFYLVVNAARKAADKAWVVENLQPDHTLEEFPERALIAVQGPKAQEVLQMMLEEGELDELEYMGVMRGVLKDGIHVLISRTGYTGEDGFEVALPGKYAAEFWRNLMAHQAVKPIGLGARDSLRLEMGYPLYGHDLDETTTPVEAGLGWVINRNSPAFIGKGPIDQQRQDGAKRKRVGIRLLGAGVMREGMRVMHATQDRQIGVLTSGGYSPTLETSIGMAYVETAHLEPKAATNGQKIRLDIRGRLVEAEIAPMPFVKPQTRSQAG